MSVQDVVSLRIVGRYQAQNVVNTVHYQITEQTATETEILANLLAAWESVIQTAWLARHIDTYELVGLKAFNKAGDAKTPAFSSIGENGTVVGEEVPSVVCRTVTLYTESSNHRRHGRLMLSGGATTMFDVADGSVTTTEITALDVLGALFVSELQVGADAFQCVLPATATLSYENISDAAGRETPSVIRSRRIKQFLIG